jgi:mannose-6-phosphate isomerase-like protein (cupin superfamily)
MSPSSTAPTKFDQSVLIGVDKPKCRFITPMPSGSWSEPVIGEWDLRGESWTDLHPHSEYAIVLEGHLFVESGGVTVDARAGDAVRVPPGTPGRYFAPEYARMIFIYGPSAGEASQRLRYERLK